MDNVKIFIVDDHPMVIEGLSAMLTQIPFLELVGKAQHANEAIELVQKCLPDLVLTDINMPEINGIELTAILKKQLPEIKIIAMSTFNERSYITQMIANGADGYLMKNANKEEIQEAITAVIKGRMYISAETPVSTKEISEIPTISSREKEVLFWIGEGLTNQQIADKIFVSVHTVDSHRKSLLTKFNVTNVAALIKKATMFNLI